jgi:GTP cyclohydrolase I
VAYIPRGRVLGLSKFGRIAQKHAHRLQLQERLVQGIADEMQELTGTPDVAVLGRGEHLCMSARGIKMPALMTSSVVRGRFREQEAARAEFLALARASAGGTL